MKRCIFILFILIPFQLFAQEIKNANYLNIAETFFDNGSHITIYDYSASEKSFDSFTILNKSIINDIKIDNENFIILTTKIESQNIYYVKDCTFTYKEYKYNFNDYDILLDKSFNIIIKYNQQRIEASNKRYEEETLPKIEEMKKRVEEMKNKKN